MPQKDGMPPLEWALPKPLAHQIVTYFAGLRIAAVERPTRTSLALCLLGVPRWLPWAEIWARSDKV